MDNYYVRFYYADDTYYSGKFDDFDLDNLRKYLNEFRFITLPNDKTILNLDFIVKIEIEKIPR